MISDGTQRDVREVADLTGIPHGTSTGKAKPHLIYAALMGLLEDDLATPTRLGALVKSEDRNCSEEITQWIMHRHLTSIAGADAWHFVYRELMSQNNSRLPDDYYISQMQNRYGPKVCTGVIKTCYKNGLTAINYLELNNNEIVIRKQRIKPEFLYLYAYELIEEWNQYYPGKSEITSTEMNDMHCDTCFGLDGEQWFYVLETLTSKGIIRLNRQLTPYTIVRISDLDNIISKLYSLLL